MSKITVLDQGEVEFNGEFSILEALDDAGFDVPYSCRGGNCGACEMRLISGKVEPIQEAVYEVSGNSLLTCSNIPITDIEIELI